jgi:hypothetical protein
MLGTRTWVEMTVSGYISAEQYAFWLQHFHTHGFSGPVIPLLDGHGSHVCRCKQNSLLKIINPPPTVCLFCSCQI